MGGENEIKCSFEQSKSMNKNPLSESLCCKSQVFCFALFLFLRILLQELDFFFSRFFDSSSHSSFTEGTGFGVERAGKSSAEKRLVITAPTAASIIGEADVTVMIVWIFG